MSKLILIDDDIIYHRIMKIMLKSKKSDHDTTFSYDGKAIIDFLAQNKSKSELLPDYILLDLNMPKFDGWDFLNSYQSLYKSIKKKIHIFVVSSSINPSEIARSKEYPFVDSYIIKPLTMELLDQLVMD